jgi:hypothetical protein
MPTGYPRRTPSLKNSAGKPALIRLTLVWEITHLLASRSWTVLELARRLGKSTAAMEKAFDRARGVLRAADVVVLTEHLTKTGPWRSARFHVNDQFWQLKLERLRVRARLERRALLRAS